MRVIFLDIDGVLVNRLSFRLVRQHGHATADPKCVAALNALTNRTGAYIVVSSTWRMFGMDRVREVFSHWGVTAPILDLTPRIQEPRTSNGFTYMAGVPRGREIAAWLAVHYEVKSFVIIDDDSDMEHLKLYLVKTEFEVGLTLDGAQAACRILERPTPKIELTIA